MQVERVEIKVIEVTDSDLPCNCPTPLDINVGV
jgi:hypothetical protein